MNSRRTFALVALVCFLAGAFAAAASAKTDAEAIQDSLIKLGKKIAPSVVQIRVVRKGEQPYAEALAQGMAAGTVVPVPGYDQRPYGPCTGVVIDPQGYILTSNFNVAGEVEKITVTFEDGKRCEAKLLGRSEPLDVALLKLEGEFKIRNFLPLKKLKDEPTVGTYVLVVSRTENIRRHCQTFGVVSAVKRINPSIQALQIDASLNYGNSGAPVVDLKGNFLGLAGFVSPSTAQVNNPLGQSSGVGFASTTEKIMAILDDLKAGKVIQTPAVPYLGVVSDQAYTKNDGILVRQVIDGSAAQEAGVQPGDLIVEFDGKPIRTIRDLTAAIQAKKVGDAIKFKIKRGEETIELKTTLKARPAGQ